MRLLEAVEEFIQTSARPLDKELYYFLTGKGSKNNVILELKKY